MKVDATQGELRKVRKTAITPIRENTAVLCFIVVDSLPGLASKRSTFNNLPEESDVLPGLNNDLKTPRLLPTSTNPATLVGVA